MQQSVIYQDIKDEGRVEGREEGRLEESQSLVLRQLNRRIGEIPAEAIADSIAVSRAD